MPQIKIAVSNLRLCPHESREKLVCLVEMDALAFFSNVYQALKAAGWSDANGALPPYKVLAAAQFHKEDVKIRIEVVPFDEMPSAEEFISRTLRSLVVQHVAHGTEPPALHTS